jgi:hypothetical protein
LAKIEPRIPGQMEVAEKQAATLGQQLAEAIKNKRIYPEQEAVHRERREYFKGLVELNKDIWMNEYEYWRKMD